MKMKQHNLITKMISIIASILFVVISIPFALAAEPIALTESNVAVWPTFDGDIYYGQKLSESELTVNGGLVTTDGTTEGTVIEGHFEFIDLEYRPISLDEGASIRFVPKDTQSYTGFEIVNSITHTYKVLPATPVLVDPVNDLPVATKVASAGKRLMTTTLSGGALMNPYTNEVIEGSKWGWEKRTQAVNESGYFKAVSSCGGFYNKITLYVFVGIEGDTTEIKMMTTIAELPTASIATVGDSLSSVTLTGGKAVDINGIEVKGKFTFEKDYTISQAGTIKPTVIFVPEDGDKYSSISDTITIEVNPMSIAFVDDEGNVVEDFTFEVEPGVKMNDVQALITENLRVPQNAVIQVEDNYGFAENGRKYKLTVIHDDSNYEGTELYFTIKFKETEIVPSLKWVGEGQLKVDCGEYAPPGTFTVYYVIGETETKIGDVKGNSEIIEWTPDASGDYGFKVVYNPAENDYFKIDTVTTTSYSHFPEHKLIATGSLATVGYSMGETATVTAPATDPALPDKPYYGFTGWTDVKGNTGLSDEELANATVTFTMPDEDVELKANYEFSLKLFFEWILQQIVQFFTFIVNAVKDLFALAVA